MRFRDLRLGGKIAYICLITIVIMCVINILFGLYLAFNVSMLFGIYLLLLDASLLYAMIYFILRKSQESNAQKASTLKSYRRK